MRINISEIAENFRILISTRYNCSDAQLKQIGRKFMPYLGDSLVPIFQQGVKVIYSKNMEHVVGSLPIEEVCNSLTYELDPNNAWKLHIFLDDSLVRHWVTKEGDPIYKLHSTARDKNREVDSFEDHWRSPIEGMQEEDYMDDSVKADVEAFIHSKECMIKMAQIADQVIRRR